MEKFKFIDLFSGIGGFHQAMEQLGGKCVFASEIDKFCNAQYERNYGMSSDINIREVKETDIPEHEVLCAGFPCQAFSKAGKQAGLEDKTRGTLFFEIVRILKHHHTPYIVLENVRNLVSHDNGNTWRIIQESLRELGYRTTKDPLILSPHYFGIPQIRERVIILGKYDPENIDEPLNVDFGKYKAKEANSIYDVLDEDESDDSYRISEYEEMVLTAWDEFYQGINLKVIGFPVWADYFKYKGSLEGLPDWKAGFIKKNVKLYEENKEFIDSWLKKYKNLKGFTATHHKFEWQCGENISSIWEGVIQFRPSGIRVKMPNNFQALVAMVQIPVIGKYKRRLSVKEAARLQSFPVDNTEKPFLPDDNRQQAYKQFGNSVNVEVIRRAAEALFKSE
ncbi:MAG: DNA cytosine methyltransferase [Lachnospiraceae bacterium]|nr:DNA cytosine methyltransferase [Lachnospiraceae bacterium]